MQQREQQRPRESRSQVKHEVTADGRFFDVVHGAGLIGAYVIARAANAKMPTALVVATRTVDGRDPIEVVRIATIKGTRRTWVR